MLHISHVASGLSDRGVDAVVAVPGKAEALREIGPIKLRAVEFPGSLPETVVFPAAEVRTSSMPGRRATMCGS